MVRFVMTYWSIWGNRNRIIHAVNSTANIGVVVRNSEGQVCHWERESFPHVLNAETAEAIGARCAVIFAYELDLQHTIFEGDCSIVIKELQDSTSSFSAIFFFFF